MSYAQVMHDLISFYETDYMWLFETEPLGSIISDLSDETEDYDEMSFKEWFFWRKKMAEENK